MSHPTKRVDILVVGAGIVGLSTAMFILSQRPDLSVLVVEKEPDLGRHQTGHNSGVIHRGVYYAPGSLNAKLCVDGARRLTDFCDSREIPYRLVGKLIIASSPSDLPALRELHRRGIANGVDGLRWLESAEIANIEPNAVGAAALHSPTTGIVDFGEVASAFGEEVRSLGGRIMFGSRVAAIRAKSSHVEVSCPGQRIDAALVVTCAGLQSDRIAAMTGHTTGRDLRVIPFRGDYHVLTSERSDLIRGLIYPVPDPRFPFLGVHFTPRMDGSVWVGPNAVLAFSREGYRLTDISLRDVASTMTYIGFLRLALRYWKTGAAEMWRDVSRHAFAEALRRYVPSLRDDDLARQTSGVRAQAVAADGSLVDDFEMAGDGRFVHVRNAPSPAATSSLAIGEYVGSRALAQAASL